MLQKITNPIAEHCLIPSQVCCSYTSSAQLSVLPQRLVTHITTILSSKAWLQWPASWKNDAEGSWGLLIIKDDIVVVINDHEGVVCTIPSLMLLLLWHNFNASDYVFVDDVDMNIFFCCIGIFINHCYQLSRPPHPPTPWHLRLRQWNYNNEWRLGVLPNGQHFTPTEGWFQCHSADWLWVLRYWNLPSQGFLLQKSAQS